MKYAVYGAVHGAAFAALYLLLIGWSEGPGLGAAVVAYGALVGGITGLIAGPTGGRARRAAIGASVMTALTLGLAVTLLEPDRYAELFRPWTVLYLAVIGAGLGAWPDKATS